MSQFHKEWVQCPVCLNEENLTIWDSVDAVRDPDLKERLLRKTLQSMECRNCGQVSILRRPLLYRDDRKKLLVWLDDNNGVADTTLQQSPVPAGYHVRRVHETNHLIETIHIFDEALDDRLMAVVKVAVLRYQEDDVKVRQLYFLATDMEQLMFLALGEDEEWYQLPISRQLYENTEKLFAPVLPEDTGWLVVDGQLADGLIRRLSS